MPTLSMKGHKLEFLARTLESWSMPPSRYRWSEYLLANRVCSVSKSSKCMRDGHIYDISQPLTSNCLVKKDCAMRKRAPKPTNAVTTVAHEHAHGLRITDRFSRGLSVVFLSELPCLGARETISVRSAAADSAGILETKYPFRVYFQTCNPPQYRKPVLIGG